ncbi:MAG: hypothetical protein V4545_07735 [Pseudomonadota bacterium]
MKIRASKSQAIKLVSENASEYLEFFRDFQAYDGGWLIWPEKLHILKRNLKLDNYVTLYSDQKLIDGSLMLFLMGRDGLKEWGKELSLLSPEDQQSKIEILAKETIEDDFAWVDDALGKWPETPEEEIKSNEQFDLLDEDTKKQLIERWQFLFLHILSSIHNFFSIMVNGESMTSLVPKAINGDIEAFFKSVKIDRNLLSLHPYFIERYQHAQTNGHKDFLKRLAPYQATPQLIGRIRYPGLYIVFAMLETLRWLDDLTHSEILDICDAAGLDRWQNRIEDVNSVTKQLKRYRRYQKTSGLSMH